jgi:hypothetical protein
MHPRSPGTYRNGKAAKADRENLKARDCTATTTIPCFLLMAASPCELTSARGQSPSPTTASYLPKFLPPLIDPANVYFLVADRDFTPLDRYHHRLAKQSPRPPQPNLNYNIDYHPSDPSPRDPTYFHDGMVDGAFCWWLWDGYEEWEPRPSPPPPPTLPTPLRSFADILESIVSLPSFLPTSKP